MPGQWGLGYAERLSQACGNLAAAAGGAVAGGAAAARALVQAVDFSCSQCIVLPCSPPDLDACIKAHGYRVVANCEGQGVDRLTVP